MKNIPFLICLMLCGTFQASYGMIARCVVLYKHPLEEIKKLISQGHNINAPYPTKEWKSSIHGDCTAFQIACKKENEELVKFFLTLPETEINSSPHNFLIPLHCVIAKPNNQKCRAIARLLIADSRIKINEPDDFKNSALHIAITWNNSHIIPELLQHKDIILSLKNHAGDTPAQMAAKRGNHKVLTTLLNHKPFLLHEKDKDKRDLFQLALKNNRKKLSFCLLSYPLDVFTEDNYGNTPLHWACFHDNVEVIDFILNHYKEKNRMDKLNKQNSNGNTPLHACMIRHDRNRRRKPCNVSIKKVLDAGAYSFLRNDDQHTPLALCFVSADLNSLNQESLQKMALSMDETKNTQLHLHVKTKNIAAPYLQILVSQGVSVWRRNKDGKTATDLACTQYEKYYQKHGDAPKYGKENLKLNDKCYMMRTFLRLTWAHVSYASFKLMLDGLLPELQYYIMLYYYSFKVF
jgi:ankyrin repeat protein